MSIDLDEQEEIFHEIQKIAMKSKSILLNIGDIVRWTYEVEDDPSYGSLYMVVGYNKEMPSFVVTRMLTNLGKIQEFHVSQLQKV